MNAACPTAAVARRRAASTAHAEHVDAAADRAASGDALQLCAGAIHVIADPGDVALVRCAAGAVWVTQAGLRDDVVLEAGQSFAPRPRPRGKVIVQALIDSTIAFEPAHESSPALR